MTNPDKLSAMEWALLAMSEVDASSRGEGEARACLEAAIPAYLQALAEDGETVEAVAKEIYDLAEGPVANQDFARQCRQWDLSCGQSRAALRTILQRAKGERG
jgi:hypothetical protein